MKIKELPANLETDIKAIELNYDKAYIITFDDLTLSREQTNKAAEMIHSYLVSQGFTNIVVLPRSVGLQLYEINNKTKD